MTANQTELLFQPLCDPFRHRAVAPRRRLITEPFEIALSRIALWQRRLRQRIPQIGAEIESAFLCDAEGIGDRLRKVRKKTRHLRRRLQIEMIVGPQMRQSLVDSRVQPDRHQRILQPVSFRRVVMHIVGCHQWNAGLIRHPRQLAVAHRVPLQKVPLKLHVDRVGAVPPRILPQPRRRLLPLARQRQPRQTTVTPPRQQNDPLRMRRQMPAIKPRLSAVNRVGKRKQTRNVRVPLPRLRQQRHPRTIIQRQLPTRNRPDPQTVRQTRKLQRAAQIRVRQRQRTVTVLLRLRQQFVRMRRPHPKRIETLRMKLNVSPLHKAHLPPNLSP